MRSRFMFLMSIVLFGMGLIALRPARSAEPESISLEQIRETLIEWRASFTHFRVVYETRGLHERDTPPLDELPPDDPISTPRFSQVEWIWSEDGVELFDHRFRYWTPGKIGHRDLYVNNIPLRTTFHARYQISASQVEELKSLEMRIASDGRSYVILSGLYWPTQGRWLPDILWEEHWQVDGVEPILGDPCVKISRSERHRGTVPTTYALWLDCQRSYLPRRYLIKNDSRAYHGTDYVVDQLQCLGDKVWFPKQVRIHLCPDLNQLLLITAVEINPPLDFTRFEPPQLTAGTVVSGEFPRKLTRHDAAFPTDDSKPTAHSSFGCWNWTGLLVVAVLLVGSVLAVRHARTKA